jgi:PAS domain S-box-containing protein
MPFFSGKNVVASMVIYSDEIDFFDKEEVELLREVSYDISFALGSMDRDKTMQRSEDKSACQSFIIEGMEDAFFVSDEKSLVTGWNKAAEELFGWTADEALGRDSSALLKTEWVDMAEDEVKRLLGETGRVRVRASHRSKSGDVIITESVVNAVLGPQGRTKGYVTASRPVAVRKVAGGAVSD